MNHEGTRLRHLAGAVVQRSSGKPAPYVWLESIEPQTGKLLSRELPEKEAADSLVFRPGDVLFGKLRPYLVKSFLAEAPGTGSGELLVLRPGPHLDSHVLLYLTLSRGWLDWVQLNSYGSKMPRPGWEEISEFRVPNLSVEKQQAIADFVDRETAQIDAMVGAQERLVKLLEERRQNGWFTRAVRAAGLPRLTPHDLRHTAASLAISAGPTSRPSSACSGNASAAITLDTYSGLFPDDLDALAAALNDAATGSNVVSPLSRRVTRENEGVPEPWPFQGSRPLPESGDGGI